MNNSLIASIALLPEPDQIAPEGDWLTWMIDADRGIDKSRSAAERLREQVCAGRRRIALVGET